MNRRSSAGDGGARVAGMLVAGVLVAVVLVGTGPAGATPATIDWPGGATMHAAGDAATLGRNLSGLASDGDSGLWVVRDGPGELLQLERSSTGWTVAEGGRHGLRYPGGNGSPDAEAVTVAGDGAVYVGAERSNEASDTSRNSILRYDVSSAGTLTSTGEWSIASIVGRTAANTGVEGLAWIADDALVSAGLRDAAGGTYAPAEHPGHGSGLFAVGAETGGTVYLVALGDAGATTLVAQIDTGLSAVMELSWSRARGELWALCDDHCGGTAAVLRPGTRGFEVVATVQPPAGMSSLNDEGFTILPACTAGAATAVWADDGASGGTSLREATLPCAPLAATGSTAPSNTPASNTPASNTPASKVPASSLASTGASGTTAIAGTRATTAATSATPATGASSRTSSRSPALVAVGVATGSLGVLATLAWAVRRARRRPPSASG